MRRDESALDAGAAVQTAPGVDESRLPPVRRQALRRQRLENQVLAQIDECIDALCRLIDTISAAIMLRVKRRNSGRDYRMRMAMGMCESAKKMLEWARGDLRIMLHKRLTKGER